MPVFSLIVGKRINLSLSFFFLHRKRKAEEDALEEERKQMEKEWQKNFEVIIHLILLIPLNL